MERSGGRGRGRDLIITVGTMAPGFIRRVTVSSFVVPFFSKWVQLLCLGYNISTTIMIGL